MATLQQIRLDTYGHRNASDDLFADQVYVKPSSVREGGELEKALHLANQIIESLGTSKVPVVVVSGTSSCAIFALGAVVAGCTVQLVSITLPDRAPSQIILVTAAVVGKKATQTQVGSNIDMNWLHGVLAALAPVASCVISVDALTPSKERLVAEVLGGHDPDLPFVLGLARGFPTGGSADALLSASVVPLLPAATGKDAKALAPVPIRQLPAPMMLDSCGAVVMTSAAALPALSGAPAVALGVYSPASSAGLETAAAAAAALLVAIQACSPGGTHTLAFQVKLPATYRAAFSGAAKQATRARGSASRKPAFVGSPMVT